MRHPINPVTVQEENDWLAMRRRRANAAVVMLIASSFAIGTGYAVGMIEGAPPSAQFAAGLCVWLAVLIVAGIVGKDD